MNVKDFVDVMDSDFYTGVPDSLLKPLCNYLINEYGDNTKHHIIAANEGNAAALAAGYYLATNKIPVVYMQNSGEGNIVNPVASLLSDKVYAIPMIYVIGWRGEPNIKDEPQHILQGMITLKLLEDLNIKYFVVRAETTTEDIKVAMKNFQDDLLSGKQVAFVVCKNVFSCEIRTSYTNEYTLSREKVIKCLINFLGEDLVISTTGKISRALFEIREKSRQGHAHDFLTLGSMGHCSSIALGISVQQCNKRIWCIDGDGALLMHMGALAVTGRNNPKNFVHIVINNGAYESVGGMPTAAKSINLPLIAAACGYSYSKSVDSYEKLEEELEYIKNHRQLSFLEIKTSIASENSLGRPTILPTDNKRNFMGYAQ